MDRNNLHPYQEHAVQHVLDKTHCALFLEMGLGKTVSTLTAINELIYSELAVSRVLVLGPKRVVESVWAEECGKWEHLKHLRVSKVIGPVRQRKAALAVNADIYLLSRDNVAWLCGLYGGSRLPFDMLVIDELSSFKAPASQRFKALRNVQTCFRRVVGLTGTPAPNGLLDLWSQIFLLDRGERLGRYVTKFRETYFTPAKRNGAIVYKYAPRADTEKLIYGKISDICMSMRAEDYLELPGRTVNHIKLVLPPDILQRYNDFEREQVFQLFADQPLEEAISAVNAAALAGKLLQFANGAIYDAAKVWHAVHDIKLQALSEIVEAAGGKPVLVAWTFRHDRERIAEHLKAYNPVDLKGDKEVRAWNAGEVEVLLMHPASGGHGLNLQAGGHIIVWFGQTWSLELEQQLNARLDRQGQRNHVIIHKLIVADTLDEDVVAAQGLKASTQEGLMQAVRARIGRHM